MRTAIYVYAPATLTITTQEDSLTLASMNPRIPAVMLDHTNSLSVEAGVYMVLSNAPISASSTGDVEVESTDGTVMRDKDKWPVPPTRVTAELSLTIESIQDFFSAKSIASV